ncbi:CoA pyrophosphatase [Candidatus Bathyarchaeota archaeon]|nr:CoA pyrophosphatase [Candidatus Bathyarchaeota archaeon]
MDPLEKICSKIAAEESDAWAAVGVILRWDDDELETLVVKRAVVEGDPWSGDMAFPGGKKCGKDSCLIDTVQREVFEETGIELSKATFLGYFPMILTSIRPGSTVLPLFYLYNGEPEIHLNSELTKYYWIHLSDLRSKQKKAIIKNRETPVFDLGENKIWGLTYKMLEKILEMLEI